MDATWLAALIIGAMQPFIQEAITRGKFVGASAARVTLAASFAGGAIAMWLMGGFAGAHVPAFSLIDPSPLVLFLFDQAAKIALVARITYAIPGVGPTGSPAAPANGLVQKVAGTQVAPAPAAPPAAPSA